MKKLLVVALAMIAVVSTGIAQEAAVAGESSPLSFDVGADIYSAYIWRGIQVNDEPVVQPAVSLGYDLGDLGSISAGVWGNYDLTDAGSNGDPDMSEIDYTLSYAIDVRDFTLEVGNIWYQFPNSHGADGRGTEEVYGSVAYNNDVVTPSVALYYDYDAVEGFYGTFSLAKDFEIAEQVTAGVFGSIGAADEEYASYYTGGLVTDDAFVDSNLGVYASYAVTDNISVGATLVWTSLIDSDLRDAADMPGGQDQDMLWGGINLAASF